MTDATVQASTEPRLVKDLIEQTDFKHRLPKEQWYTKLLPLVRLLEMNHRTGDDYQSNCVDVEL